MYVDIHAPCVWFNACALYLFMGCLSARRGQGLWEVQGLSESVHQTEGVTPRVSMRRPFIESCFYSIHLLDHCRSAIYFLIMTSMSIFLPFGYVLAMFNMSECRALFAPSVLAHLTKAPHLHESLSRHC